MQNILVEPSQWGSARIVAGMRDSTAHWLGGSARIVPGPADRPDHLIISQESAVPPREMSRTNRPYLSQMADNPKNKGALLSRILKVGENKVPSEFRFCCLLAEIWVFLNSCHSKLEQF